MRTNLLLALAVTLATAACSKAPTAPVVADRPKFDDQHTPCTVGYAWNPLANGGTGGCVIFTQGGN